MKFELLRIDPLRAAKVAAAVYAVFLIGAGALVLPLIVLYAVWSGVSLASLQISLLGLAGWICVGPFLGWGLGYVGAAAYNFVVRWTGGLLIEGNPHLPLMAAIKNGIKERLAPRDPATSPRTDTIPR